MDDVDQRVREIANWLLEGKWSPKDQLRYSEEYGIPYSTVRGWTAQAARVLRFLRGPDDEFRERLLANLDNAGRIALELKRTWIGKDGEPFESEAPDVKAYIAAQVEQAKLLRLDKPPDDTTEPVSVELLAAALRAAGHEVKLNERTDAIRPQPASTGATDDDASADTERPQRVEGFLESEDDTES